MPYIHLSVTLESYKASLMDMLESINVKPTFTYVTQLNLQAIYLILLYSYKEEPNGWRAIVTVVSKKFFAKGTCLDLL